MQKTAENAISTDLYTTLLDLNMESDQKQIIIALAYPSVVGSASGCLADPMLGCIPPESLNHPAPDYPLLELDLDIQAKVYQIMLGAISQMEWIDGVVARGYYPPAVLQDKSTSIHGKPAEEVLAAWYQVFSGTNP